MDTGRAGTIYGGNVDQVLGKSWFAKNGYLPQGGFKLESLHGFPAHDYQFLASSVSLSTAQGSAKFVGAIGSGHSCNNLGWNFGANYTKALFVVSHVHGQTSRNLLMLHDAEPTDRFGAGAKGIGLRSDLSIPGFLTGKISAASGLTDSAVSGWTTLETLNAYVTPVNAEGQGLALYVDTAGGGIVKAFIRIQYTQWIEIGSIASAHLAGVIRCASLFGMPNESGAEIIQLFNSPIGIYTE